MRASVRVCVHASAGVRIVVTAYKPKPPRGDSVVSGVFIKPYHFLELSIIMKNTCSPKLNTKNSKVFVISCFFLRLLSCLILFIG